MGEVPLYACSRFLTCLLDHPGDKRHRRQALEPLPSEAKHADPHPGDQRSRLQYGNCTPLRCLLKSVHDAYWRVYITPSLHPRNEYRFSLP